jgi:hypothetical protein
MPDHRGQVLFEGIRRSAVFTVTHRSVDDQGRTFGPCTVTVAERR